MKLSSVVIGLGRIGQGYDEDDVSGQRILTHANGFHHHPQLELMGGVDPNPAARSRFQEKFQRPAFETVAALYESVESAPEIVSIGVPTSLHFSTFREVIAHKPRAILCEKPLADRIEDAQAMVEMAAAASCTLLVNYLRRFEPGSVELKRRLAAGDLGEVYKGTLFYARGLLNNGSHFIDLLRFWLGPSGQPGNTGRSCDVCEIELLDRGRERTPIASDPEPDFKLRIGGAVIYGLAAREECFSMAELELVGTRGTVRYQEGGNRIGLRKTHPHPLFAGYRVLDPDEEVIPTDLGRYQKYVLDGLLDALGSKREPASSGRTALETLRVVHTLLDQMKTNSTTQTRGS